MATGPFIWGGGGEQLTPQQAAAKRKVAEALIAQTGAPKTFGEGLNRVGEALVAQRYMGDASAAETAGAAERKSVIDALMGNPNAGMNDYIGAIGNEWVADDPGSVAVVQALMGRQEQEDAWAREDAQRAAEWAREDSDPLRQLQLQQAQAELDQLTNPPPAKPEYDFVFGPDGTLIRTESNAGTIDQLGTFAKPEAGPLVTINNGGTDEFYKKLDTDLGEQQVALIDAGQVAQGNNMRLGKLEELLSNAPQGAQGAFVQFAGSLGIPVPGASELQAAQAIINQMVPGQRPPGSGTMSDADLALFKQSLPSILNQPGGNAQIIATTKAINDYTIQQAEIARQIANREITPAKGRELQAAVPNPLADFNPNAAPAAQAAPAPSGTFDYNAPTAPEGWGGDASLWKFMSPEDRALW